ncbi:MAG: OmpW family outer membrane protein, partial [Hyphomicrobium sp.]
MRRLFTGVSGALAAAALVVTTGQAAVAGDYNGNFMVRAGVSVVIPDTSVDVFAAGAPLPHASHNADIPTEVIPSATLTYFFNKNLAAELFCCFAKVEVEG